MKTATPLIKANLATFGEFEPGSLQMRISGLGLVQHQYDPATKTISYQLTQKLRDTSCTVIIEAKAGVRKVQASWSFNIDEDAAATAGGAASPAAAAASPSPAKR